MVLYPPSQGFSLDIEAVSGIIGSISIACWVVVFSPQIFENFQRGSADGLSTIFIAAWLIGDLFNILGAVLQGVLPTMIILAVYYTLADLALLCQIFYYRGFTLSDNDTKPAPLPQSNDTERTPLISTLLQDSTYLTPAAADRRRSSFDSFRDHLLAVDATHLSPATPLVPEITEEEFSPAVTRATPSRTIIFNCLALSFVSVAGVLGWALARLTTPPSERLYDALPFSVLGQIFGYICALLYLASRIPQLLLNYRRKSTSGLNMLFFLFAVLGNLTYALSIMAYEPICKHPSKCRNGEAARIYWRYIAVNASWILGSAGSLVLDLGVFVQFFWYKDIDSGSNGEGEGDEEDDALVEEAVEARVARRVGSPRAVVYD
ncbi:PQ loop repeat protein [Microthyrium microscopicum]|uniref:PQ loop repeat protein n=1 Tax=Microthyrium microscopicum TaxID=703497 RepID=A0A6A6UNT2_9PEZI|nr:PQ loop repeat protein [Microthyrium microscopicum]